MRDVKTNRNELHNAFLSNIEITKANQGDDHSGIILPGDRPPLTGLLDKVLASFMKDVKDAYDGSSKVVDENGEPLVVYSGHGNLSMWGDKWKPNLGTAGGFYATEDPKVASGYAQGKIGDREFYENGSQYRLAGKNGKLNKKIWQYELSDSQKTKLAELRAIDKEKAYDEGETFHLNEMDGYIQDNKNYDSQVRRWSYRGGSNNLQNIFEYYESMGYTIAYAKQGDGPLVERQQKNDFEDLLDTLGIEWNSYEWSQPGVIPVYLSIKNPLDASKPFPKDLLAALKEKAKYKRNKTDSH